MSESILERYQRILRADPSSRVFVELARAHLERGEPERAAETCARGVQHHPDSVVARVLWGKALLALGQADDALARFDEATAVEPGNPYAYDLAGEALVLAGERERAAAFLERGAAQHPRDPRIQLWLARAREPSGPALPASSPILPPAPPTSAPPPLPHELLARMVPAAPPLPASPSLHVVPDEPPGSSDEGARLQHEAAAFHEAALALHGSSAFVDGAAVLPSPAAPLDAPPTEGPGTGEDPLAGLDDAPVPPTDGVLGLIPDEASVVGDAGVSEHDAVEPVPAAPATRTATPAPSFARRHLRFLALVALVVAAGIGAATFLVVRDRERAASARVALDAGRVGLARDTLGSLRQAARVVEDARRLAPRDPELAALLVEISALLAHDFGDGDARGAARAALASTESGRGTYAARWLVATDAEREDAAGALLSHRSATPLASTIAGEVLLSLGDTDGARVALDRAARERPPMLRAVTAVGDLSFGSGDLAGALEQYRAVLRVQATHPRAALGLGEVSLAASVDLPGALRTLEAVAADRDSTVPLPERLRFDLTLARLLAANGRAAEALPILERAATRHVGQADVTGTLAQVLASAGDLDRALATARQALEQSRGDARYRELIAQLQLRRGRFRELLATSEREPSRTLRTYRGIARLALGDVAGARTELEATRRDGKMTAEAAGWAALVEIAAGRSGPVTGVVDALLELPMPHPAALLARGRLDLAGGRRSSAEHHLREAIERDPDLIEARVALGELLLDTSRAPEALELLNATVARAPWRGIGRVALAKALVATGKQEQAVSELAKVLASSPEDPPAEAAARPLLQSIRPAAVKPPSRRNVRSR